MSGPHPKTTRRAVIDLGTNTFHLLIADVDPQGGLQECYRERSFVKLGAAGIATIGDAPFRRGINALIHFKKILDEYNCSVYTAIGTAALRTASNGAEFIRSARRSAGVEIRLISGDEEARLITKGVLSALPALTERTLIMDIGGGSTEFIIADDQGVRWQRSFPLGVSVLYRKFHQADPITDAATDQLEDYLRREASSLISALACYPTQHLAGAAGTFDVLTEVLRDPGAPPHPTSHPLLTDGLAALTDRIIRAPLAERLIMPDLPEQRADMIVVAMLLIRFVVRTAGIERITVSDWAMKEGILLERYGSDVQ